MREKKVLDMDEEQHEWRKYKQRRMESIFSFPVFLGCSLSKIQNLWHYRSLRTSEWLVSKADIFLWKVKPFGCCGLPLQFTSKRGIQQIPEGWTFSWPYQVSRNVTHHSLICILDFPEVWMGLLLPQTICISHQQKYGPTLHTLFLKKLLILLERQI